MGSTATIAQPALRKTPFMGRNAKLIASAFVVSLLIVLGFQAVSDCRAAELSGYPDESAHYVTGLMFRGYFLEGGWRQGSPLAFAERFYLHYPKVAIGHWPPAFYALQTLWMALFPPTISSLLWLEALLMAAISAILFDVVQRRFGLVCATVACAMFLCFPVTQVLGAEVMAEPLLTLATLLSVLAISKYFSTGRLSYLVWFGVFVEIAAYTKSSGFALIPVPLSLVVVLRRWSELRKPPFWLVHLAIVLVALPWHVATLKMTANGLEGRVSVSLLLKQGVGFAAIIVNMFGWPLLILMLCGACLAVASPKSQDPLMACCAVTAVLVIAFHWITPAGVETRRFFMGLPAMLMLAALPFPRLLAARNGRLWAALALLIVGVVPVARAFPPAHKTIVGYRSASDWIVRNVPPDSAVLLSSDVGGDGMLIAEVAQAQPNPSLYLVRADKLLVDCDWMGYECTLRNGAGPNSIQQTLDSIPVSYAVVDRFPGMPSPLPFVRDAIAARPDLWKLRETLPATAPHAPRSGEILIYQRVGLPPTDGVRLRIDLSRMLGRTIGQ